MSRWDKAVFDLVPDELRGRLALAIGRVAYRAYREVLDSERWQRLEAEGARVQRLLFASTSTKDPTLPDTLYVEGFAAPMTINTMPDETLEAFHDHGKVGEPLPADGGDADEVLAAFAAVGIDIEALAAKLQSDGATAFVHSWHDLMKRIDDQVSEVTEGRAGLR